MLAVLVGSVGPDARDRVWEASSRKCGMTTLRIDDDSEDIRVARCQRDNRAFGAGPTVSGILYD